MSVLKEVDLENKKIVEYRNIKDSEDKEGEWDLIIKPKGKAFDLGLKDVWNYRDLMWLFVRRDFVAQYKQTIMGPLWHFIQPIFTTLIFLLIFGKIAKIPTEGIHPILFYMSGITMWNYFSVCLTSTSNTFVANAGIFGKVYFPRLVLPLSVVISNIVKFGIQFLLLSIVMIYLHFNGYNLDLGLRTFLVPFLLFIMAGIGLGLGIIISSLTTKYRDFNVLLGFGVQLMMYLTPVAYPLSFLENKSYGWIINANPLTSLIEGFRFALFGEGTVDVISLAYSFTFMIIVLLFGTLIFNKVEKTFMDTV